jgi:hypothetical protein
MGCILVVMLDGPARRADSSGGQVYRAHAKSGDPCGIRARGTPTEDQASLAGEREHPWRANERNAQISKPRHRNENVHWECWKHDPDGYTIVLCSLFGSAKRDFVILGGRGSVRAAAASGSTGANPSRNRARPFR